MAIGLRRWPWLVALFGLLQAGGPLQADPCQGRGGDDLDTLFLAGPAAQLTVASFHEQLEEEAPASVLIITADEIRAAGARTLGEALERHAGLDLANPEQLVVRGVGARNPVGGLGNGGRVLLLINGVRANDVFTDGLSVGLSRGVFDIAHIEVIKGPASALFGTSAYSGIINIVTMTGENCPGAEARVRSMGDGAQALDGRISLQHAERDLSGGLSGRVEVHPLPDFNRLIGVTEIRGNAQWRALNFSSGLTTTGQKALPEDEASQPPADAPPPEGEHPGESGQNGGQSNGEIRGLYRERLAYWSLSGEHTFVPWFTAHLGLSGTAGNMVDVNGGFRELERRIALEGRGLFRLNEWLHFTAGGEIRREESRGEPAEETGLPPGEFGRHLAGVYAQVEMGPVAGTTLTTGVRAEKSIHYGGQNPIAFGQVSPRIALVSGLSPDLTLKVLGGFAYELPSLALLFHTASIEGYTIQSNQNLEPETLASAEVQFLKNWAASHELQWGIFYQDRDSVIAPVRLDERLYQYQNSLSSQSVGLEAEGRYALGDLGWAFANLTVLNTQFQLDGVDQEDVVLFLPPEWSPQITVGTQVSPRQGGDIWISATYDPRYELLAGHQTFTLDSGHLRLDARTAIQLGHRFQLALAVRNLLGAGDYQISNGQSIPGPGSEVWLELAMLPGEVFR